MRGLGRPRVLYCIRSHSVLIHSFLPPFTTCALCILARYAKLYCTCSSKHFPATVSTFQMIVKDVFPTLLGVTDVYRQRALLWVISSAVMLPLSSQRDMANLSFTSRLSVVLDLILVVLIGYNAVPLWGEATTSTSKEWEMDTTTNKWRVALDSLLDDEWVKPDTLFVGLGVLSFAFVCQHSALVRRTNPQPGAGPHGKVLVTSTSLVFCGVQTHNPALVHGDLYQSGVLWCTRLELWPHRLLGIRRIHAGQHFAKFARQYFEQLCTGHVRNHHALCLSHGILCCAACLCRVAFCWATGARRKRRFRLVKALGSTGRIDTHFVLVSLDTRHDF